MIFHATAEAMQLREVAQTLYRYALGLDELDADLLASCFTEQAVLSTSSGSHEKGRARICDYFVQRQLRRRERGEQPRHVITNMIVLEQAEARVVVKPYVLNVLTIHGRAPSPVQVGWYRDVLVKQSNAWLIDEHYIHSDTQEVALDSSSRRGAGQTVSE